MSAFVYDAIFGVAQQAPGRKCLITDTDTEWSYGDISSRAFALAGALADAGVRAGDRVVVQIDKSVDNVALYLGCIATGVIYVPLNIAYTPAEVAFFIGDADPALFVGRPGHPTPTGCRTVTLDALGGGTLADAAHAATPMTPRASADDDWAAMLYTSGTTGRSKGAMLSGTNLVANARALADAWRFDADDVLIHVLPTFHVHGLFVALHCAFIAGAAVRFHTRFAPDALRADLRRSTVMMGVPTHYTRLLDEPSFGTADCAAMRAFISGSAPLLAQDHDAFTARTGHRIIERYGMTETMILTSNPYEGARCAGTVGFALAGTELRVTDDDGHVAPVDTAGGVEVRGEGVFLGYWQLPDQTAAAFTPDGWFRTGDVGALDAEGRLTLAGRAGDMIISGGLNIYPTEIEAVLDTALGVAESAVVGIPDPDFGEAVVAVIATDAAGFDEARARAACDATLARFKHPRRYVVVDALPRNAMGKVQKVELRRLLAERADGADHGPAKIPPA